jgi:hypothetical protein
MEPVCASNIKALEAELTKLCARDDYLMQLRFKLTCVSPRGSKWDQRWATMEEEVIPLQRKIERLESRISYLKKSASA